jgi:vitamin B12 transporter
LYSPYGNTALNPEKSFTQEGGFQLFSNNQQSYFRAVYFNTTINDVIIFQSISTAPYGKYVNFNKQASKGLELDAQAQLGKFNMSATYTHQIGELTTKVAGKDTTYKNLIRRPEKCLYLEFGLSGYFKIVC